MNTWSYFAVEVNKYTCRVKFTVYLQNQTANIGNRPICDGWLWHSTHHCSDWSNTLSGLMAQFAWWSGRKPKTPEKTSVTDSQIWLQRVVGFFRLQMGSLNWEVEFASSKLPSLLRHIGIGVKWMCAIVFWNFSETVGDFLKPSEIPPKHIWTWKNNQIQMFVPWYVYYRRSNWMWCDSSFLRELITLKANDGRPLSSLDNGLPRIQPYLWL